jgi:SAM-dependent methyltransferase
MTLRERWRRRFAPLHWPAENVPERVAAARLADHVSARAAKRAYPIRAIRYWMTGELIREELELRIARGNEGARIAELGCSRGHVRRFVGALPGAGDWVGLDFDAGARDEALAAGVTRFIAADFDSPLPLEDDAADIAVFIHVLEHLPRPDFTLGEIARILRPGGLLVAGSPVLPWPLATWRNRALQNKRAAGKVRPGGHIQALSPLRWKRLLKGAGLAPEFMNGAFLLRHSGSALEDSLFWFRLNLAWGALFPPLGNEIYLTARKNPLSLAKSAADARARPPLAVGE